MTSSEFLEKVLKKYEGAFDIEIPHTYHDRKFSAYARFASTSEKYVLVSSAKLWKTESFEHVFFSENADITDGFLNDMHELMSLYMEPELVRAGKKYPEKDHMMTFLSSVVICKKRVSPEMKKRIKSFSFEKGYLLSFRGRCEAHLIVVDLEDKCIYTNRYASYMQKMYRDIFNEIDAD